MQRLWELTHSLKGTIGLLCWCSQLKLSRAKIYRCFTSPDDILLLMAGGSGLYSMVMPSMRVLAKIATLAKRAGWTIPFREIPGLDSTSSLISYLPESRMTVIKQDDLIQSIADALQFISYYHPTDFIRAMWRLYRNNPIQGRATCVADLRMCAPGKRPIRQDTGNVNVLISGGMDVQWDADMAFEDMINEGAMPGYTHPDNVLRSSSDDPEWGLNEHKDNNPAVCSANCRWRQS